VIDGAPITVVLVVKDEPSIAESLALLKPQLDELSAPCIVVDASQGRLHDVEAAFPWAIWIDFEQPAGRRYTIAHQRNVGVRSSTTPAVAFCDAGGRPDPAWLSQILAGVAEHRVVCGPVVSTDEPPYPTVNEGADSEPFYLACSANMAFERAAFDAAGGFNEAFDHAEDIDFGWRLQDAGFPLMPAPAAVMRMKWGDRSAQRRRMRRYGRSLPNLAVWHPERMLSFWRLYPDAILYALWLIGVPIAVLLGLVSWWIPVVWLLLLLIPIARLARTPHPIDELGFKFINAFGEIEASPRAISDLLRKRRSRQIPGTTPIGGP
jgi:GT2 family glycosyltransferase